MPTGATCVFADRTVRADPHRDSRLVVTVANQHGSFTTAHSGSPLLGGGRYDVDHRPPRVPPGMRRDGRSEILPVILDPAKAADVRLRGTGRNAIIDG